MISNQKDNFLYENMRNEIEKSFLVPHITKKQDQLPAILLHRNALMLGSYSVCKSNGKADYRLLL